MDKKQTIPSKLALPLVVGLAVIALLLGIALIAGSSSNSQKISALNEEIASLMGDNTAKDERIAKLTSENGNLSDAVLAGEEKISALTADVQKKTEENEALSASVAVKEEEVAGLTADVQKKTEENEALSASVAAKEEEIAGLTADVQKKTEENEALSASVAAKEEEIAGLTADVQTKTEENEALSASVVVKEEEIAGLTADVQKKTEENEALSASVAAKEEEIAGLTSKMGAKNTTNQIMYDALSEKDAAITSLSAEIAQLNETLLGKDSEIEMLNDNLAQQSGVLTKKGEEIDRLNSLVASKEDENNKLKGEIGEKQDEIIALQGLAAEKETEITDLKTEVASLQEKSNVLSKGSAEQVEELAALADANKKQEAEIENLKKNAEAQESQILSLKNELAQKDHDNKSLTDANAEQEEKLLGLQGEVEGLRQNISELEAQNTLLSSGSDEQGKTILSLTVKLARQEEENTKLTADAVAKEDEIALLKAAAAEMEKTIAGQEADLQEEKAHVDALTQKTIECEETITQLNAALVQLNAQIEEQQQKEGEQEAALANQAAKCTAQAEEIDALKQTIQEKEDIIAQQKQDVAIRDDQIAALKQNTGSQGEEIISLTEEKSRMTAVIAAQEEELNKLIEGQRQLQAEVVASIEAITALKAENVQKDAHLAEQIASHCAQAEMLMAEIERKNQEADQLYAALVDYSAEVEMLRKEWTACLQENQQLKEDVEALKVDVKNNSTYTFDLGLEEMPVSWNPHQTDAEDMLDWLSDALYTYDYNETRDGYQILPAMAADFPADVTAEYAGDEWGISAGETGRVWQVNLRKDLQWQDGTPITADTFVTSYQWLAEPLLKNTGAEKMWNGAVVFSGVQDYHFQNELQMLSIGQIMEQEKMAHIDDFMKVYGNKAAYIDWAYSFGEAYDFAGKQWKAAEEQDIVKTPLSLQEMYAFYTNGVGAQKITWTDEAGRQTYVLDEVYVAVSLPEVKWERAGVQALDDYTLLFILEEAAEEYQVREALTEKVLVPNEMYAACIRNENDVYSSVYATSAETTLSCGPYLLSSFLADEGFVLKKNPAWYGWQEAEQEELYQTTCIRGVYEPDAEKLMEMFLRGELDELMLTGEQAADYAASDALRNVGDDAIFAMVFNPDLEALTEAQQEAGENKNKTILTVKEFREAMAYAMDRIGFITAASVESKPALGIFSEYALADPSQGILYRSTPQAKNAIVNFLGLRDQIGEGKKFATADEALSSGFGYDLEKARECFNQAYEIALKEGLLDADDVIEICIGTSNSTGSFYNNGYDFIVAQYTEAVKGTQLEGKLTFVREGNLGENYAVALRNHMVDMLFGVGWQIDSLSPYEQFQVYVDARYQYDSAWDYTAPEAEVALTLNGTEYTASAWKWFEAMVGQRIEGKSKGETVSIQLNSMEEKAVVLAALENAVLQNYNFIPLMQDAEFYLKGLQIEYGTDEAVYPMNHGGVKYITYQYTDREWEIFVEEHDGALNYR